MGRTRENPRYNVLSFRASDAEREEIENHVARGTLAPFVLEAVLEKIRRDRQRELDHALSS